MSARAGHYALTGAGLAALVQHEKERASALELGAPVTLYQAKVLHVQRALAECGWNLTKAAAVLDISRRTLQRNIERWGIDRAAPAPPSSHGGIATFAHASQSHVTQILTELGWNITEGARALGVNRRTLYRLLDRWGVERPEVPS